MCHHNAPNDIIYDKYQTRIYFGMWVLSSETKWGWHFCVPVGASYLPWINTLLREFLGVMYCLLGGACGPYGGRESSVQGAGGETRGEETTEETKA